MFAITALFAYHLFATDLTTEELVTKQKVATFASKVSVFINNFNLNTNEDLFKEGLVSLGATDEDITRILSMDRSYFFYMLTRFYRNFHNNIIHELAHNLVSAVMHKIYDVNVTSSVVFDRDALITDLKTILDQNVMNNVGNMVGYNDTDYTDVEKNKVPYLHMVTSLAGIIAEYRYSNLNEDQLKKAFVASLKDFGLFFASYATIKQNLPEPERYIYIIDILGIGHLIDTIIKDNQELYNQMTAVSLTQGYLLDDQLKTFYQKLNISPAIYNFAQTKDTRPFVKIEDDFNRFLEIIFAFITNTELMIGTLKSY